MGSNRITIFFNNTVLSVICVIVLVIIIFSYNKQEDSTLLISTSATSNLHNSYLIPPDTELKRLSKTELILVYWRYINTIQVLCRNQTRIGLFKDGGKEVCIDNDFIPRSPCLVYSFGSAFVFDFENVVYHAFKCEIVTFDPSIPITDGNRKIIPKEVNYQQIGLDSRNHVNDNKWPMLTLDAIMEKMNHTQRPIDIVKIDIEGWEFAALQQAIEAGTLKWVKQLLIEIHFVENDIARDHMPKLIMLRGLYEQGFRIFMRDRNPVSIEPLLSDYNVYYTPLVEICMINMKYRNEM